MNKKINLSEITIKTERLLLRPWKDSNLLLSFYG